MGTWGPFTVLSSMVMTVSFVGLVEFLPFLSYVNMYNNLSSYTFIILEPFTEIYCVIYLKAIWCSLEIILKWPSLNDSTGYLLFHIRPMHYSFKETPA